jgi:hypothetical protein
VSADETAEAADVLFWRPGISRNTGIALLWLTVLRSIQLAAATFRGQTMTTLLASLAEESSLA